ncbi:MAG: elongation factor P [Patescibacteria group bacterium]|jgi:elongation factor P
MIATDLKTGAIFKENDTPFLVLKYFHVKVSRGSATVRVKVRNLLNNSVLEKSYMASTRMEYADVVKRNAQYLYNDQIGYVFMDPETYAQFTIPEDVIGEQAAFLLEGIVVQVMYFEDEPVSVELPNSLVFEVAYTEPGYRGNTVTNVLKEAKLPNGTVVRVPPFIKIGDTIKVDTRTGEYLSKA